MATYLQSVLNSIGYKATVKPLSSNISFTYMQNTKNKVQIGVSQWYQDYPAASDFLNVLLGCGSFHPGSDTSINISGYCNKKVDADMQKALQLGIEDPPAALKLWTKVDKATTDDAAQAVLFNPRLIDFVVEARRQLHLERAVLHARGPGVGPVVDEAGRPGV